MSDWLKIHDLIIECKIGVFDWERNEAQKIWVDLEIPIEAHKAAIADNVQLTLDYGTLITAIRSHAQQKTYKLLETLAEDIAGIAVSQFRVHQVTVSVKKRSLHSVGEAIVEIVRPLA